VRPRLRLRRQGREPGPGGDRAGAPRRVAELHDAYLATGLGPDGSPLDPLEVEVPLATSAELIQTVDVALAEKAALGG
jgi:hypothetical protein